MNKSIILAIALFSTSAMAGNEKDLVVYSVVSGMCQQLSFINEMARSQGNTAVVSFLEAYWNAWAQKSDSTVEKMAEMCRVSTDLTDRIVK